MFWKLQCGHLSDKLTRVINFPTRGRENSTYICMYARSAPKALHQRPAPCRDFHSPWMRCSLCFLLLRLKEKCGRCAIASPAHADKSVPPRVNSRNDRSSRLLAGRAAVLCSEKSSEEGSVRSPSSCPCVRNVGKLDMGQLGFLGTAFLHNPAVVGKKR